MSCCCGCFECCCCAPKEDPEKGLVVHRRCRDILCLLFFVAFWVGMIVVCSVAFAQGDTARLVYGVDSYGLTCGVPSSVNGSQFDMTNYPNLYYLNPLELLSPIGILFAKKICVATCPGSSDTCPVSQLPCSNNNQFRCPYYQFAEDDLYGKLPGVSDQDTEYFGALANITVATGAAGTFLQAVNSLGSPWSDFISRWNLDATGATVSGKALQLESNFPGKGPCYPVWVETSAFAHRCFPSIPSSWIGAIVSTANSTLGIASKELSAFTDEWNTISAKWSRYVGDISKGWLVIVVAGLGAGVLMSLLWMVVLRYLAGVMVWLTIFGVNFFLIGFTLYCFSLAGLLGSNGFTATITSVVPAFDDPTSDERNTWRYIGIAAAIVAGIVLLITLLMISRIRIAVACIKVASQAVGAMPSILLFPLLPFVLEVGLVIYWVAVTALLYTAGDLTANCVADTGVGSVFSFSNMTSTNTTTAQGIYGHVSLNFAASSPAIYPCYTNMTTLATSTACGSDPNCFLSYKWSNTMKYMFIYHFFGLLWTNQFIVGYTCVTIAGAIGSFYWAGGKRANMSAFPVLVAIKNTTIYSLGSIAFGACVVAIIQLIRFLLQILEYQMRRLTDDNCCVSWCMSCVTCCVWCLEKIVMFINRNAYIIIGIKGKNYCFAACTAIKLIITNALRLSAVSIVGDLLLFLGKLCVSAGAGLAAFGMCRIPYYSDPVQYPYSNLSSPVMPVAISCIIGFVVAEIFFAVYEMAIDTILISFCEDCDDHDGHPLYAPPLLMDTIGPAKQ